MQSKLSTPLWDSPPIVCNLRDAAGGFEGTKWAAGVAAGKKALCASKSVNVQVQRVFYNKLMEVRFGNRLRVTVERRLTHLFAPYFVDFGHLVVLDRCFRTLKECRVAEACKVLKCWTNGWATSRRYHEDQLLPCLLGCRNDSDCLEHYLLCPHLFGLWRFLSGGLADENPLIRWGLIHPNKLTLHYVACVFSGYHAVRRDFNASSCTSTDNRLVLTSAQLRRAWSVFADAFKVEARELALQQRQFSLPEFLIEIT